VKGSLVTPPSVTIDLATILGTRIILTMASIASEVKFIMYFYQLIKETTRLKILIQFSLMKCFKFAYLEEIILTTLIGTPDLRQSLANVHLTFADWQVTQGVYWRTSG